jgi:hypothetical protein
MNVSVEANIVPETSKTTTKAKQRSKSANAAKRKAVSLTASTKERSYKRGIVGLASKVEQSFITAGLLALLTVMPFAADMIDRTFCRKS